jgi:hypothetical protein
MFKNLSYALLKRETKLSRKVRDPELFAYLWMDIAIKYAEL